MSKAGTKLPNRKGRPLSRAGLIACVRRLADTRNVHTLSSRQLEHATGITPSHVHRYFDSLEALIDACNLRPAGGHARAFASDVEQARRWRAEAHRPKLAAWKSCGGPRFGAPLNVAGLQHAPTNEMGVVFLFAGLAPSLGYVVESVGTRFPDCIAKRRLSEFGEPWEQVRIEFEFRSRNFLSHKHDAKQCDVIVCWEHDWPDCPLEVLVLKTEVEKAAALKTAAT